MKTCALIPSYNVGKIIGELLREIRSMKIDTVVIDDGSSDDTGRIAKDNGATLITHQKNMGKGFSLREGFDYFLKKDYDVVITMDGDGQHDPKAIPRFLEQAEASEAGIIVGNRMHRASLYGDTKNMPFLRWLTNRILSKFISWMCGLRITDSQCGYRLIKRVVLEKISLSTSKYEIDSEILIKAAKQNFQIDSIPIRTIYRKQRSKINPITDTLRFVKFIWKMRS